MAIEAARERSVFFKAGLPELEVFAFETDAGEAAVGGEGNSAVFVVPGIFFVFAEDGELGAVDGAELVDGELELERGESVDFNEGPAALEVVAEGGGAVPFGGGLRPGGEARVGDRPGGGGGDLRPNFVPELSVMGGETVKAEGASGQQLAWTIRLQRYRQ